MDDSSGENLNSIIEVRQAREQAQMLRDQLMAEYQRLEEEKTSGELSDADEQKSRLGREAMRKAIAAADCALASIDQALLELERVKDEPGA